MGAALNANPAIKWYIKNKCPECADIVDDITKNALVLYDKDEIRKAEIYALMSVEDFVIFTKPQLMDTNCDFIYAWEKKRLFEMADFTCMTVLDVGSGSGRLAFAAAEKAAWVYASEPVDSMREYLRDKIKRDLLITTVCYSTCYYYVRQLPSAWFLYPISPYSAPPHLSCLSADFRVLLF